MTDSTTDDQQKAAQMATDGPANTGAGDALENLSAEKLAGMLRDKRKAEASLRQRLRETEAERDKLAGVVTGGQREALADAAKERGLLDTAVDDLHQRVNLEELLADDGGLDHTKMDEALGKLRDDRPHWFQSAGRSSVDHAGGSGEPLVQQQASWSDIIGQA